MPRTIPVPFRVNPDLDPPQLVAYMEELRAENYRWHRAQEAVRAYCKWHWKRGEDAKAATPSQVDLRLVTSDHLKAFVQENRRLWAYETMRVRLLTLKQFFGFAFCQGWLYLDPGLGVDNLKRHRNKADWRILTPEQVDAFLAAIVNYSDRPTHDLALFGAVLSGLGVRPREAILMTVGDVNTHRHTLKVFGKGQKERILPLENEVRDALYRHLESCQTDGDAPLWQNRRGQPLSQDSLSDLFHKYRDLAGIEASIGGPHAFRHFMITQNLIAGRNLEDLAKFVGHSSPRELEVYFHISNQALRSLLDQVYGFWADGRVGNAP